jgi:hypothetical protein
MNKNMNIKVGDFCHEETTNVKARPEQQEVPAVAAVPYRKEIKKHALVTFTTSNPKVAEELASRINNYMPDNNIQVKIAGDDQQQEGLYFFQAKGDTEKEILAAFKRATSKKFLKEVDEEDPEQEQEREEDEPKAKKKGKKGNKGKKKKKATEDEEDTEATKKKKKKKRKPEPEPEEEEEDPEEEEEEEDPEEEEEEEDPEEEEEEDEEDEEEDPAPWSKGL